MMKGKMWATSRRIKGGRVCTWRKGRYKLLVAAVSDGMHWSWNGDPIYIEADGTMWFPLVGAGSPPSFYSHRTTVVRGVSGLPG